MGKSSKQRANLGYWASKMMQRLREIGYLPGLCVVPWVDARSFMMQHWNELIVGTSVGSENGGPTTRSPFWGACDL